MSNTKSEPFTVDSILNQFESSKSKVERESFNWSKRPIKKKFKRVLKYESKLKEQERDKLVTSNFVGSNFKVEPLSEIYLYRSITNVLNDMEYQLQSMINREIKRIEDTFDDSINPEREALFTKIARIKYDIKQLVDNYSNVYIKL